MSNMNDQLVGSYRGRTQVISAATTISPLQSGTTFNFAKAAAPPGSYQVTLPAPSACAGGRFRFVQTSGPATGVITVNGGGGNIQGFEIENAAITNKAAAATMLINAVSTEGTSLELSSNGISWSVIGYSDVAAAFT